MCIIFPFQCKYTTKSDVWSFGTCLWEILQLASVRPYATLDDDEVLTGLESLHEGGEGFRPLDRPQMCPKDLYELMCECWKRDDAARPSFREIHLVLQRKNLGYSPQT
jgi:discoidin domain receptor family protein 2